MSILEVSIPTYNRASKVRSRVEELLELRRRHWFHITVFDNGSTDNTAEVLDGFLRERDFRYVRAPVNGGISRNIMRCFEETKGDWVWTLSDDDPVKDDDIDTILETTASGTAGVYVFKAQGNHIHRDVTCHSPKEFLESHDLLCLAYMSAVVYSREAIFAGMHLLAPAAYTLLPH